MKKLNLIFYSRLERIIKLLETAGSSSFRSLAAKQIGEIVQSQPSLARSIIGQVSGIHSLFTSVNAFLA